MWVVRALIVVILFAVLLGFSVYNANERVAVTILQTRYYNVPLIYVAYWAFIFGMLVSLLLFVTIYFKQVSEVRRFKRKANDLAHEVAALRNRSLEESTNSMLPPKKDTDS
jgi:uncharacterized integral membrane protein